MLKYCPDKLQRDISCCGSHELLSLLKQHGVNPKTIREIAVMNGIGVLRISYRDYVTRSLNAGYGGGGPSALEDLLKWCGCTDETLLSAVFTKPCVHFMKDRDWGWFLSEPISNK